jgi:hypothetical protein
MLLMLIGIIAVAGIIAGCVLAISGYSSAGAFAVSSACVGVLGTLVAQKVNGNAKT